MTCVYYSDRLYHHGILGMKWGRRRFQNEDGSLTPAGRERYGYGPIGYFKKKRDIAREARILAGERSVAAGNSDRTDAFKTAAALAGTYAAARFLKAGLNKNGDTKVGKLGTLAIAAIGAKFVSDYISNQKQEKEDREKFYEDVAKAEIEGSDKYKKDRTINAMTVAGNPNAAPVSTGTKVNNGVTSTSNTAASKFKEGLTSGIGEGAKQLGNALAVGSMMYVGKKALDSVLGKDTSDSVMRLGGAKLVEADRAIKEKKEKDEKEEREKKEKEEKEAREKREKESKDRSGSGSGNEKKSEGKRNNEKNDDYPDDAPFTPFDDRGTQVWNNADRKWMSGSKPDYPSWTPNEQPHVGKPDYGKMTYEANRRISEENAASQRATKAAIEKIKNDPASAKPVSKYEWSPDVYTEQALDRIRNRNIGYYGN